MISHFLKSYSAATKGKGRAAVIAEYCKAMGVSKQKLYRLARENGHTSGRKERTDKGDAKVDKETLKLLGGMMAAAQRKNKDLNLPASQAVRNLKRSNLLSEDVSTSTVCRHLRNNKMARKDILKPTPHRNLTAKRPNEWHLFDISPCLMYRFDKKKGMTNRTDQPYEMVFYPGKIKNFKKINKHLLRYLLIDKATGWFFWEYFYAAGENAIDTAQFFFNAWKAKEAAQFIAHGAPINLFIDKGSMADNAIVKGLMGHLTITVHNHIPGNPRAKAGVETMHRWVQNLFESGLTFQRPASLEELNAWAMSEAIEWNRDRAFRGAKTRFELFSKIKSDELRIIPDWEVYQLLQHVRPQSRKVRGDLIVEYYNREYFLEDPDLVNEEVMVSYNPYHYPIIEVTTKEGITYTAEPLPAHDEYGQPVGDHVVSLGEFKAHKKTTTQKNIKKGMERVAEMQNTEVRELGARLSLKPVKCGEKGELKLFQRPEEMEQKVQFLKKEGTPIEVLKRADPVSPITSALKEISIGMGRPLKANENAEIREKYPVGVPTKEIQDIVSELLKKQKPSQEQTA